MIIIVILFSFIFHCLEHYFLILNKKILLHLKIYVFSIKYVLYVLAIVFFLKYQN